MSTKHCRRCDTIKPLDDFNRRGKGVQPYCRGCQAEIQREYRARDSVKGKIRAYAREWNRRDRALARLARKLGLDSLHGEI